MKTQPQTAQTRGTKVRMGTNGIDKHTEAGAGTDTDTDANTKTDRKVGGGGGRRRWNTRCAVRS